MTKLKNLYGLILAGGYSRRMGRDKALLNFHGKPQIEHVYDLLQKYCTKIFLSKRTEQSYVIPVPPWRDNRESRISGSPTKTFGDDILIINDTPEFSNIGPLGGILSAMKAYPEVSWLVMACDLPFVTDETLATLVKNRDKSKTATAFKSRERSRSFPTDGWPEPLCAIWEGGSYSKIKEFLKKDIHCPRKVLMNSDTHLFEQTNPQWLDNVNNPDEFKQWKNFYTTS